MSEFDSTFARIDSKQRELDEATDPAAETLVGIDGVERKVVRVGLDIVHAPAVRLRPCVCGRDRTAHDARLVDLARLGKELPPVPCSCGRVVIGQRNLVLA